MSSIPSEQVLRQSESDRQMADELIKENPYDARHLFYEEIQRLIEAA